ncbi:MAG TPA: penicillin-binding protein 2 [Kiloniellales bacterium]|jgi:cell division protein FtsI (penicillin-binding protein 3)
MIRHPAARRSNCYPAIDVSPPCAYSRGDARIRLDGSTARALEIGRTRLLAAGLVFALAFTVIGGRLVDLTLLSQGSEPQIAGGPTAPQRETGRADIVDRNGVLLATTLPTASLWANPHQVRDPAEAASQLNTALPELSRDWILDKLSSDRGFVWLKRGLTPRQQYAVNRLGIPGLQFQQEPRRFYPQAALTAHSVGFADVDDNGLAGIERSFNSALRGAVQPVTLSLDLRIQHVMTQALSAAKAEFKAIGATGIVMDVHTGEVIAMASLPDFDPNRAGEASADARFNRATLGVYEMGSVFKIFTTAMALDRGVVTLDDGYDTSKPIRIARFTITDYKPKNRWLSIPEIFIYSSNIGTARMAMDAGTVLQKEFLSRLGLTTPAAIEVAEVGQPMLPTPWRDINTLTISYGHGMAVSPIQLVSAVSAVVNGGTLRPATLIKRPAGVPVPGTRVISERTSQQMRQLMRLVVTRGTGKKADAEGYLVGGKTGTADKLVDGKYARDARVSSFAGAFPMNNPRYAVFVMIDEPKGNADTYNYATGGWVAAPAVRQVVEQIGPMLGIAPVRPGPEQDESELLLVRANARAEKVAAN